ncbi:MAG: hypothetical protein BWZ02_02992 [Lentisphaerae bacterium ADurb.BinA184]|nr:MAG: hypothetical protein BWZ02_02992 [Lentisphaerae bacterium ADurb.BinA184]
MAYIQATGREAHPLRERVPAAGRDRTAVVRVALLDADAHDGQLALPEMPGLLADYLRREVLPWRDAETAAGRAFVLTTDHGLSWRPDGLSHGAGGPFEQAVFRAEWTPQAPARPGRG